MFNREKTIAIQNLTYKEQEKQKKSEASKIKLQNRFKIYFLLATLITILVIAGILLRNKRLKQLQNMRTALQTTFMMILVPPLPILNTLLELSKQHLDPKDNANKFLNPDFGRS